jgi:hypothetical protein
MHGFCFIAVSVIASFHIKNWYNCICYMQWVNMQEEQKIAPHESAAGTIFVQD